MPENRNPVAVALLYASGGGDGHLRDALKEYGAAIVYEALSSEIDRDALEGSGARVVVVNLAKDSDDYIDQVYDVLDSGQYEVVFNDAEVSRQLSGWDQARWARNLAAKITRQPGMAEPPRPAQAPAVQAAPDAEEAPAAPTMQSATQIDQMTADDEAEWQRLSHALSEEPAPDTSHTQAEPPEASEPVVESDAQPDALNLADLGAFALGLDDPDDATPAIVPESSDASMTLSPGDALEDSSGTPLTDELEKLFAIDEVSGDPDETRQTDTGKKSVKDFALDIPEAFNLADLTREPAGSGDADQPSPSASQHLMLEEDEHIDRNADVHNLKSLYSPEWDLEPMDPGAPEPPAPPKAGASQFGINKVSAAEYLDASDERPAATDVSAPQPGGLELMPMEEAIKPTTRDPDQSALDAARNASRAAGTPIDRACVLGASIGGPEAVRDFLAAIPAGFPALFILAQHMGDEFLELMSAQLRRSIGLTVRVPTHGERVAHGDVLIVPTSQRLKVDREGVVTFEKIWEKPANSPSIDQVLHDVADVFGEAAVAIIFSGMAQDAIDGGRYLKSRGGKVWVQDPKSCVVSTMVEAVQKAGLSEFAGSPTQLAQHLIAECAQA